MTGTEYQCYVEKGHLFVTLDEGTFLVDTGSPTSFGRVPSLTVEGQQFPLQTSCWGMLTTDKLSGYVGRDMDGLMGTDILNRFDVLWDVPASRMGFSTAELLGEGECVPLSFVMGVPKLTAVLGETPLSLFFDTGASISYVQGASLAEYPTEEPMTDFYPIFGSFTTDTVRAPLKVGQTCYPLRCGQLPMALGVTLKLTGTEGIVGNELLTGRRVGYFPRRSCLVLGERLN